VLGDSWGSALGIMLVQRYPELFYAYIGTGQMVDFVENDSLERDLAIQAARERGDAATVQRLEGFGPPPYPHPASELRALDSATWQTMQRWYTSGYEQFSSMLQAPEL
jgi:hypothetical protein